MRKRYHLNIHKTVRIWMFLVLILPLHAAESCQTGTVDAMGQYPLTSPGEMAFRPDGQFLFVLDRNVVSVIDTGTNSVVNQMPAGTINRGMAISSDGSHLFIGALAENKVLYYGINGSDAASFTEKGALCVIEGQPAALALSSDDALLYIVDRSSGDVIAVSTADGSEISRITTPLDDSGVAVTVRHPARLLIHGDLLYVLFLLFQGEALRA